MHNPSYQFNDDIIPIAAEILAQIAVDYLNG
jgi:metal-dependent amidase/aminoacylase/carboxypeptidase family protein